MPCRRVRTRSPPMVISAIRKNFSCSTVSPWSFSITCHALGPWIWNRQTSRDTALPYGREGERGSCRMSTS